MHIVEGINSDLFGEGNLETDCGEGKREQEKLRFVWSNPLGACGTFPW